MLKTNQPSQTDPLVLIQLLTANGPVAADGPEPTFRITPNRKEVSAIRVVRLPHVGDLLTLLDERDGQQAFYKVVLVNQAACPWPEEQPTPLTADVYAIRVELLDEIKAVAPTKPWRARAS